MLIDKFRVCTGAIVIIVIILVHKTPLLARDNYSYDEIVQGMIMRDSMIKSATLSYTTTSSFPNGELNVLPTKYMFVYKDDYVYMENQKSEDGIEYFSKSSLNDSSFMHLDMNNAQAFIGNMSPWAHKTELRTFFRVGLQSHNEPCIGGWFEGKKGKILEIKEINGQTIYVLSDGDLEEYPEPNGERYIVWISPDQGFSPVRVYEYRRGALHHLWEYKGLRELGNDFWAPSKANVWYFDVGKKIKEFDPENPGDKWLAKIDVDIQEYTFNKQEYPDDYFNIKIPDGFYVSDALVGVSYTIGRPDSELALVERVDVLKNALVEKDFGKSLERGGSEGQKSNKLEESKIEGGEIDSSGNNDKKDGLLAVKEPFEISMKYYILAGCFIIGSLIYILIHRINKKKDFHG